LNHPEPDTSIPDRGAASGATPADGEDTDRPNGPFSRVRLEMSVLIWWPNETSLDPCRTIEIGASSALLVLPKKVDVSQSLLLINPESSRQVACRILYGMPQADGGSQLEVEFLTESPGFWGPAIPSGGGVAQSTAPPGAVPSADPTLEPLRRSSLKRRRVVGWPALVVAGIISMLCLLIANTRGTKTVPKNTASSAFQGFLPDEARTIPGIANYRLATTSDFDSDTVSLLTQSGEHPGGEIEGAFSAVGASTAYVLIGKNATWRIVIVGDGQLRCDAQYKTVAIAVRVPKEKLQKIDWITPPSADAEGDGLLIVRSSKDLASGVVLFLRGDQVVSGTPIDYRQVLLNLSNTSLVN
jgi:hypothetical protein